MRNNLALFITFLLGLFIIIGVIIAFFLKKKSKVLDFIFAFAFSLLVMLIILDLLPEAIEHLTLKNIHLFLIFSMLGLLLFKLLDNFIPEHAVNTDHKLNAKEEKENITHIGLLATIALIIHNIVEGMAIYLTSCNDISLGLIMSVGVGLHNIPLGIIITTTLNMGNNKKPVKYYACLGSLVISSFIGGLIPYLLNINTVNDTIIGSLLALTLGMLLYIIIFELFPKVIKTKDKKITFAGIITGFLILFLGSFVG